MAFLVMAVLGIAIHFSTATPADESASTTGRVAGVTTSYSRHGENCTPYADFTVNGKPYVAHGKMGTSGACSSIGKSVPVAYDPVDPSQASIPATGIDVVYPWLLAVVGLIGFAVLVVNHFRMRKRWA